MKGILNITHTLIAIIVAISFNVTDASAQSGKIPPLYSRDTLKICFIGDVMMHTKQIEYAYKNGIYDFSSYFEFISEDLSDADISIANLEFTLAGKPYTGYPAFSAPDSFAEYITSCGIDVFLTANNHIYDKGSKGVTRTLQIYREMEEKYGIMVTGTAEDSETRESETPLFIRKKGITIGLINFTYGTNLGIDTIWPKVNYQGNRSLIEKALEKSSNKADFTIVLPHWGEEYVLRHSESQEETAKWLASHGADLIIGSHPHVPQDFMTIEGQDSTAVQVAYSLGNAVSNMSAANTQLELMATAVIVRQENGDLELLPIEFTYLWCSRPGGYRNDYTVLPVEEFIGSKADWMGGWEYDKMISTYNSVQKITGIIDKNKIK